MYVFDSESLLSRLALPEKCEFTIVNDHFEGKHNADSKLYGQTLTENKRFIVFGFINPTRQNNCPDK